ncbi:hypothetical protein [Deinococcus altitudinis]|uniref:hypothetical protein n=1 Tax=Deinococcus altitudinis TaxID=468914 RepID=UPI0038921E43
MKSSTRSSIWDLARWILVLPVTVLAYILVTFLLIQGADQLPIHLPGNIAYTLIFSVASWVAVFLGGFTAPTHRFRTACVLTALLGTYLGFVIFRLVCGGNWEPYLLATALSVIMAALIAVYTFWRLERRAPPSLSK